MPMDRTPLETPILDQLDYSGKMRKQLNLKLGLDWMEVGPGNHLYSEIIQRFELRGNRSQIPYRVKLIDAGEKNIYFCYGQNMPEYFMAYIRLGESQTYYWIDLNRLMQVDPAFNPLGVLLKEF